MKMRRFGIGTMMGLVAVIAVDVAAIRKAYLEPGPRFGTFLIAPSGDIVTKRELLVRGALPMANILAIGLLVGLRRRGSRPSLPGFVGVGTLALVAYSCWALFVFPRHYRYDDLSKLIQHHWLIPEFIGGRHALRQIATSIVLVAPQLALALMGGFLSRKLRRVDSRSESQPAPDLIVA